MTPTIFKDIPIIGIIYMFLGLEIYFAWKYWIKPMIEKKRSEING